MKTYKFKTLGEVEWEDIKVGEVFAIWQLAEYGREIFSVLQKIYTCPKIYLFLEGNTEEYDLYEPFDVASKNQFRGQNKLSAKKSEYHKLPVAVQRRWLDTSADKC